MTTCFFTENLLSDYAEGILPSARHDEVSGHLKDCELCSGKLSDLKGALTLLKSLPRPVLSPEAVLRITEAAESKGRFFLSPKRFSRLLLIIGCPIVLLLCLSAAFPTLIPIQSYFAGQHDEAEFARYFPLLQGASEILEEQAIWLQGREGLMGSVWEEGGLAPDEFEKTFQSKSGSLQKD